MELYAYILNGEILGIEKKSYTTEELNGNKPYLFSDTDVSGYTGITSIVNLDKFGFQAYPIRDYKYIRTLIKELYRTIGWDNLNYDEMKVICKYMASGIGAEYHNGGTIWSDDEQFEFQQDFRNNMKQSRIDRDEAVCDKMTKLIFMGLASQFSGEKMIREIQIMRNNYLLDGLEGRSSGDNTYGLIDYLSNTDIFTCATIFNIDQSAKTFTVSGATLYSFSEYLRIFNSTGNDGTYNIKTVEVNGDFITVEVIENIPDITADGILCHNGFMRLDFATPEIREEFLKIYVDGVY